MAKKSRGGEFGKAVLAALVLGPLMLAQWLQNALGIPIVITITLLLGLVAWVVVTRVRDQEQKTRAIQIANVDAMSGVDFERYLTKLLAARGYGVRVTGASGDLGVDLVASRNGCNIAVQAKRHASRVSRRAVSDAVAGMQHYRCSQAMVITNNYFSDGAETLARSTGCVLVDRDELSRWVLEFQQGVK